jgi:hypothetical protein
MAASSVREWLATHQQQLVDTYGQTLAEHYGLHRPLTERQIGVLERAVERGYLFDPSPEPWDFRRGRYCIEGGTVLTRLDQAWPERFLLPGMEPMDFMDHRAEWREECNCAGAPWACGNDVGEPMHFQLWPRLCHDVRGLQVFVTAGRFALQQWATDAVLGVHVEVHDECYGMGWDEWAKMVQLLVPFACQGMYGAWAWLRFDGQQLSAQVASEEAEGLAVALCDLAQDIILAI